MQKILSVVIVSVLAASAALPAHAQFYIGGSVGNSDISIDGAERADQFLDLGFEAASTQTDTKDTAYRVFAGYQLHKYFAIEGAYVDLGRFAFDTSVVPEGELNARTTIEGAELSVVGLLPLNHAFSLYARVGAFAAETETTYTGSGSIELVTGGERQKERGTTASYAAGVSWNLNEHVSFRGEYARYSKLGNELTGGETDADLISLGVAYRF